MGGVSPPSRAKAAEGRSAQAKRGRLGIPLRRATGAEPLSARTINLRYCVAYDYRVGIAGGNGPLRRVTEDRRAADRGTAPLFLTEIASYHVLTEVPRGFT